MTALDLTVVFWGSSEFSIPTLEALHGAAFKILAVVSQPDRPRGRHQQISATVVKQWAAAHGLPCWTPRDTADPVFEKKLRELNPAFFVVVAYGNLLKPSTLGIPWVMPVNLHASLLPRHRGAAPVARCLLAGDPQTGVTVFRIVERMDAGPIIAHRVTVISQEDDAQTLSRRLADDGAALVVECLRRYRRDGQLDESPQDESQVTQSPKLTVAEGRVSWSAPAAHIVRQVRAFVPWPGAHTQCRGRRLKIWQARVTPAPHLTAPGTVVTADPRGGLCVAAGQGAVAIEQIQPPNKKVMSAVEFLSGYSVKVGDIFE